jgi:UDP-N-acetylmuramoyl-tripeptide--D-alanyl-D-alanine ligase
VETDTRKDMAGKLFIPLAGENFDGHDFIEDALEKGAVAALSRNAIRSETTKIIKVNDTKQALLDLAEYHKSLFDVKTVAVTGSVGKTTTKEMIAAVLSKKFNALKNEGNFNNEIGLPLTVFKIEPATETVVLEMGMNHFGEIRKLSKVARPDVCVITNIGTAHIEFLGSREGILKAKREIFEYMKPGGKVILNGDDYLLRTLNIRKTLFGLSKGCNLRAEEVGEDSFRYKGADFKLKLPGKHMIQNALCAAAVGEAFGVPLLDIKSAIEEFSGGKMRQEIIKTKNYTIINDAYNANPDSMKAAIEVLKKFPGGRKVAILGDMFELGERSGQLHAQVGEYARDLDVLIAAGDDARFYNAEYYFPLKENLIKSLDKILKTGDVVLIKASRGMKFEEIANELTTL